MKIAILGFSGSGKSTLAKYLSTLYNIPLLYLDTVRFEPNWQVRKTEESVSIVTEFMKNDSWVIDGNYTGFLQKERLEHADLIVYMNFSRWNCLFRALHRYYKNKNTFRESMTNGCIEKMDLEFIWWILYKGRTHDRKEHYKNVIANHSEKAIVLKNQKQLDKFMLDIADRAKTEL